MSASLSMKDDVQAKMGEPTLNIQTNTLECIQEIRDDESNDGGDDPSLSVGAIRVGNQGAEASKSSRTRVELDGASFSCDEHPQYSSSEHELSLKGKSLLERLPGIILLWFSTCCINF